MSGLNELLGAKLAAERAAERAATTAAAEVNPRAVSWRPPRPAGALVRALARSQDADRVLEEAGQSMARPTEHTVTPLSVDQVPPEDWGPRSLWVPSDGHAVVLAGREPMRATLVVVYQGQLTGTPPALGTTGPLLALAATADAAAEAAGWDGVSGPGPWVLLGPGASRSFSHRGAVYAAVVTVTNPTAGAPALVDVSAETRRIAS